MNNNCCTVTRNNTDAEQPGPAQPTRPVYEPDVDVIETPTEFIVTVEMPGVKAEGVEIEFEDNHLSIRGKALGTQASGKLLKREYRVGDYARTFALADTIDPEKIGAEMSGGVLTINLGKREEVRPRRIAVRPA